MSKVNYSVLHVMHLLGAPIYLVNVVHLVEVVHLSKKVYLDNAVHLVVHRKPTQYQGNKDVYAAKIIKPIEKSDAKRCGKEMEVSAGCSIHLKISQMFQLKGFE